MPSTADEYANFFLTQSGSGFDTFKGAPIVFPTYYNQYGTGIGSFVTSFFRNQVMPFLPVLFRHLANAGVNVASDMAESNNTGSPANIKGILKRRGLDALKGIGRDAADRVSSQLGKGKRKRKFARKRKTTKRLRLF